MEMRKIKKRLAALLAVLVLAAALPMTASAGMPTSTVGAVYDGVDIAAISAPGNGVYLGTYAHYNGSGYEGTPTPILWRVMGEEMNNGTGDGYVTMLSEYVLDQMQFHDSSNVYLGSNIQTFLAGNFMDGFVTAEEQNSVMVPVDVTTTDYKLGAVNTINGETAPGKYGSTATGQQTYLLWGLWEGILDSLFWSAHGVISGTETDNTNNTIYRSIKTNAERLPAQASWKNGGETQYWLRSPHSGLSHYSLFVDSYWMLSNFNVNSTLGVRPAFKLNPASVLFASEILDDISGNTGATLAVSDIYATAGGDAKNFKLTVLNTALSLSSLSDATGAITSGSSTRAIAGGGSLALTANASGAGVDTLAYKIVDSSRSTVGYSTANSISNITVQAKKLDGTHLDTGSYTVYVWAQNSNDHNSHEGSQPICFTLNVDSTAPVLTAGAVERTSGAAATVKFTSDEAGDYFYQLDGTPTTAASLLTTGTCAAMTASEQNISFSTLTAGAHILYVAGTDAAGHVSNMLTIVIPTYVPQVSPIITSANSHTIMQSTDGSFTVTATGNPAPTFALLGMVPAGVSINSATGVMTIASTTAAGTHSFTVTASNGVGTATTQTFTLNVTATAVAPGITGPTEKTLTVDYAATVTDAFSLIGSPTPTVTTNNTHSGKITWNAGTRKLDIAPGLPTGTYVVALTASNGTLPNAAHTFTLTVVATGSSTSGNPQTGDNSNIGLWATLLCVSALALGAVLLARHQRRQKE